MPPVDPSPSNNPANDWLVLVCPSTGNTLRAQATADGIDLALDRFSEYRNKTAGNFITVEWRSMREVVPISRGTGGTIGTAGNIPTTLAVSAFRNTFSVQLVSSTRDGIWGLVSWFLTYPKDAFGHGYFETDAHEVHEVYYEDSLYKIEFTCSTVSEVPRFVSLYGAALVLSSQINNPSGVTE